MPYTGKAGVVAGYVSCLGYKKKGRGEKVGSEKKNQPVSMLSVVYRSIKKVNELVSCEYFMWLFVWEKGAKAVMIAKARKRSTLLCKVW